MFGMLGFANASFRCNENAIRASVTADDPDGVAKVQGSWVRQISFGNNVSTGPATLKLVNGVYAFPDENLKAGTWTWTFTATDSTGLTRTATTFLIVKLDGSAGELCTPVNSPEWVYTP